MTGEAGSRDGKDSSRGENGAPLHTFGAPWGRPLRWMSAGATVLLFGLSIGLTLVAFRTVPDPVGPWLVLAGIVPALIALGALPFVIRGYSVRPGELVVHRLAWDSRILLRYLRSAEVVPHAMARSIRLLGNGGLYSFSGWWTNRTLGRFRAYVTDGSRTVVLRWPTGTVVVSPEAPSAFAKAVLAASAVGNARR